MAADVTVGLFLVAILRFLVRIAGHCVDPVMNNSLCGVEKRRGIFLCPIDECEKDAHTVRSTAGRWLRSAQDEMERD